jgi:protein-S-isoprenylcysteine O-methyltransferase Ste14
MINRSDSAPGSRRAFGLIAAVAVAIVATWAIAYALSSTTSPLATVACVGGICIGAVGIGGAVLHWTFNCARCVHVTTVDRPQERAEPPPATVRPGLAMPTMGRGPYADRQELAEAVIEAMPV